MKILGIDPGPFTSGVVLFDFAEESLVHAHLEVPNEDIQRSFAARPEVGYLAAVETLTPYGSKIGPETMAAQLWAGRFLRALSANSYEHADISRVQVKTHLLNTPSGSDSDVQHALTWRFGGDGGRN